MAVRNGHTVRNIISVPFSLGLTSKVEPWLCPDCAQPIAGSQPRAQKPRGAGKQVWACEKNGHKLDRKRTVCPIDGSPVGWHTPS
jgi:hypothetical protein